MGNDIRLATLAALLASMSAAHGMQPMKRADRPTQSLTDASTLRSLPPFSALDIDGDNNISEREAISHPGLATLFAELDRNHDGQLSTREYAEAKIKLEK